MKIVFLFSSSCLVLFWEDSIVVNVLMRLSIFGLGFNLFIIFVIVYFAIVILSGLLSLGNIIPSLQFLTVSYIYSILAG
jgi:hypothetical protein